MHILYFSMVSKPNPIQGYAVFLRTLIFIYLENKVFEVIIYREGNFSLLVITLF